MLIVLLDEPGLFVFSSPDAAQREIEAIDAEQELRAAYNESGVPYRVEWLRPNRQREMLGGLVVNATDVVHSGVSGNNGGYQANPAFLEGLPNEASS